MKKELTKYIKVFEPRQNSYRHSSLRLSVRWRNSSQSASQLCSYFEELKINLIGTTKTTNNFPSEIEMF